MTPPRIEKFTLCLVGRSGCGKGTQADFILKKFRGDGIKHLYTGQILRKLFKKHNATIDIIRETLARGDLAPWWIAVYTWLNEFVAHGVGSTNIIFDGTPRTEIEAELLDAVMEWHGRPLPVCVYLETDEEEVTKRLLLRGRADDTREAIKHRMRFFHKDVLPVIEYYKKKKRLIVVDGHPAREVVWNTLDNKVEKTFGKLWA